MIHTTRTSKELRKRILETRNGCDKKCNECILFTENNRCVYDYLKKQNEWARNRHIEFGKLLERKTDET